MVFPDAVDLTTAIWGDSLHRWTIHHVVTLVPITDQLNYQQILIGIRRELGAPRNAIFVQIGGLDPIRSTVGSERIWRGQLESAQWVSILLRGIDMIREIFENPFTVYAGFDAVMPATRAGDIMRGTMDWFKARIDALGQTRNAYVTDVFSRSLTFNQDAARSLGFYDSAPLLMANLVRSLIINRGWGNAAD
jgi:hypothetical protein